MSKKNLKPSTYLYPAPVLLISSREEFGKPYIATICWGDALLGYAAYFGTYQVDEKERTITHNRAANINPGKPGDCVRRYEFLSDDRIVLMPWERIK